MNVVFERGRSCIDAATHSLSTQLPPPQHRGRLCAAATAAAAFHGGRSGFLVCSDAFECQQKAAAAHLNGTFGLTALTGAFQITCASWWDNFDV